MAEINILLQGLSELDDHETAVNNLLLLPDIDNYFISTAFVRRSGVKRIQNNLSKVSDKAKVYLGIRNGITSIQSIFSLLKIDIHPYAIDTATNNKIFHPKIYSAYANDCAHIILGSANLTYNGLNQNIEAGSYIQLDRKNESDEKYLLKLINTFDKLPETYPEHVFQISTWRQAVQLLKEGRLEDERLTRLPPATKKYSTGKRDKLKAIPTYAKNNPALHKGTKKRKYINSSDTVILVWESKPLTRRSLNITASNNTHKTGDINLGIGLMNDIDFQTYFRFEVFPDLNWYNKQSGAGKHLERADIKAEIIIKNLSYGVYALEVTHDPRKDTKSYEQRNVMTKIKWKEAISIISQEDLLNRTLKLYKKDFKKFVIVID